MTDALQIIATVAALIVVVAVGGWAIIQLRRRMLQSDEPQAAQPTPFTLDGITAMRDSGQLTQAEFERLKAAWLAQSRLRDDDPARLQVQALRSGRAGGSADAPAENSGPSQE